MYPTVFHLPATRRVNDAIAENYTRPRSYSLTRFESLSGIIHYSLIMIFAAFFVSFPHLFRLPGPATVTKCVLARACENAREGEEYELERRREREVARRTTWTYRSRFVPFSPFAESPSYPLALVVRSFSPPLTININLKSIEKVLWSPIVLASSVFATS